MRFNQPRRFVLAITLGALVCVGQTRVAWSQEEGDTSTVSEANSPTPLAPMVPSTPGVAAPTPTVSATPTAPVKPKLDIIEFQNAPVTAVLEYYARLTNRSIIAAPNLAGNITFRSQTNLTLEEAIQALDTVLAVNGIAVLPQGEKFLKVVQIAAGPQEGPQVGGTLPPGDSLVTQVLPLKFADAQEAVTALQFYIHPYGKLLALVKSNSILITETGANIHQMLEILKYIDQPSALRMETKIYTLIHAKAADVVQRLQSILQEAQQLGARAGAGAQPGGAAPVTIRPIVPQRPAAASATGTPAEDMVVEGKAIITPDERTNKIFVFTRPSNLAFFDQMIAELDAKIEPDVITKVIPLNFADAQDVAGLLNSLISGGSAPTTARRSSSSSSSSSSSGVRTPPPPTVPTGVASSGGGAGAGLFQYAEGVRVLPDPRTNALLVMATKEDMERIEALIRSVDTAVSQVLIEVVIGEVTLDNELDVGVNILKRLFKEGQASMFGGTTTGGAVPAPSPLDLSGSSAGSTPVGATLSSALTYYATFRNLKLDVALQLLASTSKFRVLSTPIIQTLHNKEGSIKVGESLPIITSQLSGYNTVTVSNQAANGLQSQVEYKDVAIELTVTPLINPDGYVTMEIDQKVNDVAGQVNISGNSQPIITTREAKSSVTVKDQSTIVLGGLIKEKKGVAESKVPFFGDIPFLGHLFKNKQNTLTRTELIVFIRPTVLRNDAEAVAEARRRSQIMKMGEELGLDKQFKSGNTNRIDNAAPEKTQKTEINRPSVDAHAEKVEALQSQP